MMQIYAKTREMQQTLLRQGYTQTDFADVLGLSRTQFNGICTGLRATSPSVAKRACELLNKQFDDLFSFSDREEDEGAGE